MTTPLLTESTISLRDPLPILFVGVGHAGGKLIAHLPKRVPELSYAAVDTDRASLDGLPFERKILLGDNATGGMGTGGNVELAQRSLEESEDSLYALFQGVRVLILVAGLGGGTGGGVGPLLADRAREAGLVVISALVQPLEAEGGSRRNLAESALAAYREVSDSVVLFPLESLKAQEDPSMLLSRLLKRCGMEIGRSIGGLAVLLRSGWLIPLTLQDVVQVMHRADGYCRLVAVSADGEDRLSRVLDQLFTHPLLDKGSLLAHSGGIVLGMLCGPLTPVKDLERISYEVRRVLRSDAELKIGVAQDERFGQHLALVVMVAEHWSVKPRVLPLAETGKEEAKEGEEAVAAPDKTKLIQSEIQLAAPTKTKGRFKDIQPTIVEGADLDTPTFIRKGLKLSFHRERGK
jgi:cell division protein FtsZ